MAVADDPPPRFDGRGVACGGNAPFPVDAGSTKGMTDGHQRIAVDFDNTLTAGEEGYVSEEPEAPDEEMVQWVNDQYADGHTVIVWTARPWEAAPETVARLTEWGVDYHGVRMKKGEADVYVDDKGAVPEEELLEDGYDGDGEVDGDEHEDGRHEDASDT